MPALDGFDVIEQVAARSALFIFGSLTPDHACTPFDHRLVDRALRRLSAAAPDVGEHRRLARLSINEEEGILLSNKAVVIHTAAKSHILRGNIQWLKELDPGSSCASTTACSILVLQGRRTRGVQRGAARGDGLGMAQSARSVLGIVPVQPKPRLPRLLAVRARQVSPSIDIARIRWEYHSARKAEAAPEKARVKK